MSIRASLTFLVLGLTVLGCGGTRPETREGALVAYGRPSSDVPAARAPRLVVKVAPIPEEVLRDPAQMMDLRSSIERQLCVQVRDFSPERYQNVVRPHLAQALLAAGLTRPVVDEILSSVDYHRSL
jgi:hypothetical protein